MSPKRNLLILGAGQYGRVVRETAVTTGCFEKVDFLDDQNPIALGKMDAYIQFRPSYDCAFVALGNPTLRMYWLDKLKQAGYTLPVLVHPRAYVSPSALLGEGTVVEPMVVVNSEATVDPGGLLCAGCVVNHNAHVMGYCQIDCNAVVASNAVVPAGTKVASCSVFDGRNE